MGQLSKVPPSVDNYDCNRSFLPERLIEVGPSSLRLVKRASIRAGSVKQPEYCALSYYWGPGEDLKFQAKTMTTNLRENLKGLIFGHLPQVLQDAVTTTRDLSIPSSRWTPCASFKAMTWTGKDNAVR